MVEIVEPRLPDYASRDGHAVIQVWSLSIQAWVSCLRGHHLVRVANELVPGSEGEKLLWSSVEQEGFLVVDAAAATVVAVAPVEAADVEK